MKMHMEPDMLQQGKPVSMRKVDQLFCKSLRLSSTCSEDVCSNKALNLSCYRFFFFSKGMHALPFALEINFPLVSAHLAVFRVVFFFSSSSCSRQETKTQEVLCFAVEGVETPHSSPATQPDVRRWDGKQVSPMTLAVRTSQASHSGSEGGRGRLILFTFFFCFFFTLHW